MVYLSGVDITHFFAGTLSRWQLAHATSSIFHRDMVLGFFRTSVHTGSDHMVVVNVLFHDVEEVIHGHGLVLPKGTCFFLLGAFNSGMEIHLSHAKMD